VQSVLLFEDVMGVQSNGIDRRDTDMVLSLLDITWEPADDGMGRLLLTLAGDAELALQVEALEVQLKDVTRPYIAPSKLVPSHPED